MKPGQGTVSLILEAHKEVESLRLGWNAANPNQATELVERLNHVAGLLEDASAVLNGVSGQARGTLRSALRDIKRDLLVMENLTDAADAFWRGLPGMSDNAPTSYTPYGETGSSSGSSASVGIEA